VYKPKRGHFILLYFLKTGATLDILQSQQLFYQLFCNTILLYVRELANQAHSTAVTSRLQTKCRCRVITFRLIQLSYAEKAHSSGYAVLLRCITEWTKLLLKQQQSIRGHAVSIIGRDQNSDERQIRRKFLFIDKSLDVKPQENCRKLTYIKPKYV